MGCWHQSRKQKKLPVLLSYYVFYYVQACKTGLRSVLCQELSLSPPWLSEPRDIMAPRPLGTASEFSKPQLTMAFPGTAWPPAPGAIQMEGKEEDAVGEGDEDGLVHLMLLPCQNAYGALNFSQTCLDGIIQSRRCI